MIANKFVPNFIAEKFREINDTTDGPTPIGHGINDE